MLYLSQEVLQTDGYIIALLNNIPKRKRVIEVLKCS